MSFDFKLKQGSLVIKNGKIQVVENESKLIQDSLKDITTMQGDNVFHPTYGCKIGQNLIGNVFDDSFTNQVISQEIKNTLEKKQQRQRIQSIYQKLTPGEILAAIQNVIVQKNQVDPRYISVFVQIMSGSFEEKKIELAIEL